MDISNALKTWPASLTVNGFNKVVLAIVALVASNSSMSKPTHPTYSNAED